MPSSPFIYTKTKETGAPLSGLSCNSLLFVCLVPLTVLGFLALLGFLGFLGGAGRFRIGLPAHSLPPPIQCQSESTHDITATAWWRGHLLLDCALFGGSSLFERFALANVSK